MDEIDEMDEVDSTAVAMSEFLASLIDDAPTGITVEYEQLREATVAVSRAPGKILRIKSLADRQEIVLIAGSAEGMVVSAAMPAWLDGEGKGGDVIVSKAAFVELISIGVPNDNRAALDLSGDDLLACWGSPVRSATRLRGVPSGVLPDWMPVSVDDAFGIAVEPAHLAIMLVAVESQAGDRKSGIPAARLVLDPETGTLSALSTNGFAVAFREIAGSIVNQSSDPAVVSIAKSDLRKIAAIVNKAEKATVHLVGHRLICVAVMPTEVVVRIEVGDAGFNIPDLDAALTPTGVVVTHEFLTEELAHAIKLSGKQTGWFDVDVAADLVQIGLSEGGDALLVATDGDFRIVREIAGQLTREGGDEFPPLSVRGDLLKAVVGDGVVLKLEMSDTPRSGVWFTHVGAVSGRDLIMPSYRPAEVAE